MSITEYLKSAITSKSDFYDALRRYGRGTESAVMVNSKIRAKAWWARREELRLSENVYKQTDVVRAVNAVTNCFFSLHVSQNNKALVAYTPGKDFGERDKQLPTTLGKFLAKYVPELEDHEIASIVADHESELNPDVRWLTGDEIVDYYMKETSIASCMTKGSNSGNKFTDRDTHPAQAYKAPGIKLAVMWKNGKDVARSLVYEDSRKKVFIRAGYGDKALRSYLLSEGYVPGTWGGVQFNTVKLTGDSYAMPYLDANDAQGNVRDCSVALLDGKITCLEDEVRAKLVNLGEHVACATRTDGYLCLTNIDTATFMYQDIVTGEFANKLTGPMAHEVFFGHTRGFTAHARSMPLTSVRMLIDGETVTGEVVDGTMETFLFAGRHYEESDERRLELGYLKLDPVLYPNEQNWVNRGVRRLTDGRNVKDVDTVVVLRPDGLTLDYVLFSEAPKKFYKLGRCSHYGEYYGKHVIAARDNPGIVKLKSGKRSCAAVSDIRNLYDGTWVSSRYATHKQLDIVGNGGVWVDRRETVPDSLTRLMWDKGETWTYLHGNEPQTLWSFIKHFATTPRFYISEVSEQLAKLLRLSGSSYVRLTSIPVYDLPTELAYDCLQGVGILNLEFLPGMGEVFNEKLKACRRWYAEATAIEYPSEPVQLPVLEYIAETEVQNEYA